MKPLTPYRKDLISRMFQEIEKLKTDDYSKHKQIIKSSLTFIRQLRTS